MSRVLLALAVVAALAMTGPKAEADVTHTVLKFSDLKGWDGDDHNKALEVFRTTCRDMQAPDWAPLCALAEAQTNARTFFSSARF
jgi:membrane-bound lytic murein transglycosylase A